ncbi:hypothetical protein GOP47_0028571 [Adiantum capillus-veneris]|nr:hypothetical protein GOP47_0028571 [Adiantum capillus-veneris]
MVMGASAGHFNLAPQVLARRNPSTYLGEPADDSEFEFYFSKAYSDEPPASPKLQAFSPDWKIAASASMVSSTHFSAEHIYAATPDTQYVDVIHGFADETDTNKSTQYDKPSIGGRANGMISTKSDQSHKVRVNLRSLMLERRERHQLPPIVGTHGSNDGAALESTSSSSSSSSSQHHDRRKSRRWSLKLDFLQSKKGSCCPSKAAVDHPHLHRAAAANHATAMIDEFSQGTYYDAVDMGDHGDGKVESPRPSTCSLSSMSSAAAMERENGIIMRGANEGGRQKSKSASAPVSPAGSPLRASISPAQISGTSAGYLLYANGRRPASPAGPAGGVKSPMSPHAQHYRKQRARAEELGRRTSLPYRQSLFGACFFIPSRPQVAC